MGKNERIIAMLTSWYNRTFRFAQESYLHSWRDFHENGPQTQRLGDLVHTSTAADYSAEKCLAYCHKAAWRRGVDETSRRYGSVFGLEPMEYVLYDWALRNIAPKEWVNDFAGNPIPNDTP